MYKIHHGQARSMWHLVTDGTLVLWHGPVGTRTPRLRSAMSRGHRLTEISTESFAIFTHAAIWNV